MLSTMNRREFTQQLQRTLAHLGDYSYLASDQLAGQLLAKNEDSSLPALGRLLSKAIEGLKPAEETVRDSAPWRKYRCLVLRYIRLHSVASVARELGVSDRQALRIQADAIADLAAALWPQVQAGKEEIARSSGAQDEASLTSSSNNLDLENGEAARLVAASEQRNAFLSEIVDGVVSTLSRLAAAKDTSIQIDVPLDLIPIAMARTLLRQGLLSLVVACLEGGARAIGLAARANAEEVALVVQVAANTGAASDAGAAGSVSLVERLAAERSFKVGVRLLEAQGATVCVKAEGPDVAVLTILLPSVRPRTVLVVDDNPDTLRLFTRFLEGSGFQTAQATNGAQAIALALQMRPDCILLDIMMPNQDGWETLQKLRNRPETEHIPVLVCSVLRQRELALSLGAFDLLTKPIDLPALVKAVERCLASPPWL